MPTDIRLHSTLPRGTSSQCRKRRKGSEDEALFFGVGFDPYEHYLLGGILMKIICRVAL
jgi:hypothetical protein